MSESISAHHYWGSCLRVNTSTQSETYIRAFCFPVPSAVVEIDEKKILTMTEFTNALLLSFRKGSLLEEVIEKQKYSINFLQIMY